MQVDLNRLRHIVAIAKHRSFTRAAESLNISQPALSRSVSEFEKQAGLRLFDRSRGGVEPTTIGKRVIEEAEDLLRAARAIDLNVNLYSRGEGGSVSIGIGPLLASLILPPLGRHLLVTRPSLQLETIIRPPDQLLGDLMDDRIEAIFGNYDMLLGDVSTLRVDRLAEIEMSMIVRAAHPLAGRTDLSMADLAPFPVATTVELPRFDRASRSGGIICDNYEILRDLTLETDCVWLAAADLVSEHIADGRMATLALSDYRLPRCDLSLIRRRGRSLSPALRAITDHVRLLLAPPERSAGSGAVPA